MNDIWNMLQDDDRYVYHYTRASTLVKDILPTGELRFSRFQHVNDPRESKNWVFNYAGVPSLLDFNSQLIEAKLNELLKHSWRIGCFSSDPYEALVTREREDRGEDVIGAAYERGHSHPRMWTQYGEDYCGACLVFDKSKLDMDIRDLASTLGAKVYSDIINYHNPRVVPILGAPDALTISADDMRQLGFSDAVEAHISRYWKDLFFVKARDWEQEREFRWLVSGKGDEDFYIDIRSSLVGIALGDRFPYCFKARVGKYAEENSVSIATMIWQNGVPQPNPEHWRLLIQSTQECCYKDRIWNWALVVWLKMKGCLSRCLGIRTSKR